MQSFTTNKPLNNDQNEEHNKKWDSEDQRTSQEDDVLFEGSENHQNLEEGEKSFTRVLQIVDRMRILWKGKCQWVNWKENTKQEKCLERKTRFSLSLSLSIPFQSQ
jgi:hypothetical protein